MSLNDDCAIHKSTLITSMAEVVVINNFIYTHSEKGFWILINMYYIASSDFIFSIVFSETSIDMNLVKMGCLKFLLKSNCK